MFISLLKERLYKFVNLLARPPAVILAIYAAGIQILLPPGVILNSRQPGSEQGRGLRPSWAPLL